MHDFHMAVNTNYENSVEEMGLSQIGINSVYFENIDNNQNENDTNSAADPKETTKETLTERSEYILSMIGYIVGLGSTIKFPYLIFKYGGAFYLPYTLCYFAFGLPLFLLEVYLGQFTSRGCIQCWGNSKILQALGIGMVALCVGGTFTYIMHIVWAFKYLCMSFKSPLPWSPSTSNETDPNLSSETYLATNGFYTMQFTGPENIGIPQVDIALCSLTIWTLLLLAHRFGLQYRFKVIHITVVTAFVILIILMFHALSLEGSHIGISKYFSKGRFDDMNMWTDAAVQIIFMLSICEGGLTCLSSFYNIKGNLLVNSVIISLSNYFTSVFSSILMTAYFGHLDLKNFNWTILNEMKNLGVGFVVVPQVNAINVNSNLWSILYYLMLVLISFDTALAFIRILYLSIFELFGKDNIWILIGICLFGFSVTLPLTTPGGLYLFNIFDNFSTTWTKLLVAFFCSILVLVLYSGIEISRDIEFMLSESKITSQVWKYLKWYFLSCWYGISQVLLLIFLIHKLYALGKEEFHIFLNNKKSFYTKLELGFSWFIGICIPLSIIISIIIHFALAKGNISKRLKYILNSQPDQKLWYPATERDRLALQTFKTLNT